MHILDFNNFLKESFDIPFDGIVDVNGHIIEQPAFLNHKDYILYPRYEFNFSNVKSKKDFMDTTASYAFWKCVYDYDGESNKNDLQKVNDNIHKWYNVIYNKTLIIYTTDVANVDEMKERCETASKTFNFKKSTFVDIA